jgi:predicted amidohydrolase
MRIALSALEQEWENKKENKERCEKLTKIAYKNNSDLLIFPEMTLTGFTLDTMSIAEEDESSNSLHYFSNLALTYQMGIVAGVVLRKGKSFQNCAIAFSRGGVQLCQYAKIHPFSIAGEDKFISGGNSLSTFECKGLRFGVTICYDLRFPALYTALADRCDCIINIASWPAARIDHWHTLLKARAIENQIYIIGVNRTGVDGNSLEYVESSCAYSPDGKQINSIISDQGVKIIEINAKIVKNCQISFPIKNDRRYDIYQKLLETK